jgi:hypothetical protein
MLVDPNDILPTQDFLKPETVQFIFECIKKGDFEDLPPTPIVKRTISDQLLAVDGHNLIAVKQFLGERLEIHIADSPDDGLDPTSEAITARNSDLKQRFDLVEKDWERTIASGIRTFADLVKQYPDLFE